MMGFIGDFLIEKKGYSVYRVRLYAQLVGMWGPAIFFALLGYMGHSNLILAEVLSTIGMGLSCATLIGVSCSQLDIAPKYAGTVFAFGNLSGTIAGMISTFLAGALQDQILETQPWTLVFAICSIFNILGGVAWLFLGGGDKVIIY
jgi:ACS family sodium-dependent inorganic phosphate cotransporter